MNMKETNPNTRKKGGGNKKGGAPKKMLTRP